jgi:thioredoxin reductase (NADPH)
MRKPLVDVAVIGSGIAGMAAAKSVAESGRTTTVFESALFGGLVVNVSELLDMPEPTSGYRLASRMKLDCTRLGVVTVAQSVKEIVPDGFNFVLKTDEDQYRARAIVVASGAQLKRLQVPGEIEFLHRGVSLCADCDGPLFKDEEVCVVGGGDSALQAALTLAKHCRQVHVLQRDAALSAGDRLQDAVGKTPNIDIVLNAHVESIDGENNVTGISITRNSSSEKEQVRCSGVFAYVGLQPNSDFLPAAIEKDESGYVKTDADLQTAMENVYAIGAVRSGFGGMLTDALADAQIVAKGIST